MQIPDQLIGALCRVLRIRRGYADGAQLDGFYTQCRKMGIQFTR